MRQCLQDAWDNVCARPPRCPGFLLHAQGPAGVAGMQLHLLQLLGGPGQALAERLGWLAELEQQEIQEVLAGPGASTPAATSSCTAAAAAGTTAAAAAAGTFMGLLGGAGSALGLPAAVGRTVRSPACDISTQQLKQVRLLMCAAAAAATRQRHRNVRTCLRAVRSGTVQHAHYQDAAMPACQLGRFGPLTHPPCCHRCCPGAVLPHGGQPLLRHVCCVPLPAAAGAPPCWICRVNPPAVSATCLCLLLRAVCCNHQGIQRSP